MPHSANSLLYILFVSLSPSSSPGLSAISCRIMAFTTEQSGTLLYTLCAC